jgi:phosphatidylglycerophosphate synthase
MDAVLRSPDLFWWVKMLIVIWAGLTILVPVYFIPVSWLRIIGLTPALSPNCITLYRVPLSYLGYWVYFQTSSFWGYCLIVLAYTLDALDGKVARALGPLNPDKPGLGEWLDPLCDKVTVPPFMVMMAYSGLLNWWGMSVLIAMEVVGTVIRLDVAKHLVRGIKANALGKIKFAAMSLCLLACVPAHQHWIRSYALVLPNLFLTIALFADGLGIVSRVKIHQRFDAVMDRVNSSLMALLPGDTVSG